MKMLLPLFNLIQTQGISWVVWTIAALILAGGISLVVYFFLNLKKSEKEPEEDWSISSRSLLIDDRPPVVKKTESEAREFEETETGEREAVKPVEAQAIDEIEEAEEIEAPHVGQTMTFSSEPVEMQKAETELLHSSFEQEEPPLVAEPVLSQQEPEPPEPVEKPATEVLASIAPEERIEEVAQESEEVEEPSPFDEIWDELVHQSPSSATHIEAQPDPPMLEQSTEPEQLPAPEIIKPPRDARVEQRAQREPFEPPRIQPMNQREPFESPRIEPLAPQDRPSAAPPRIAHSMPEPQPEEASEADMEFEPLEMEAHTESYETAPVEEPEPAHAAPASPAKGRVDRPRKPSGAVLGLPTESSGGPLIFGKPAEGEERGGVNSLTYYGKDPDKSGGRGGTIALAVVVLLVAGAVLAYFYIPSVKTRVNDLVSRMRGEPTAAEQAAASISKAQIFPVFPSPSVKNMVQAKGSVYNTSDDPLEGLSLEIAVYKLQGEPEPLKLNVSVTPDRLEKGQQGIYEFEYDGKQYPAGYAIKKLNSASGEVRFDTPNRKKNE